MMAFLLQHAPALVIALPLVAAFAMPMLSRLGARAVKAWALLALLATESLVLLLGRDVMSGNSHVYALGATVPSLTTPAGYPIRIIIEVDAMSAFMAMICASISMLVCMYSLQYVRKKGGQDKYYTLLLLMTAGMMGLVCTGDLFSMFVFLELLSVSSGALIAFHARRGESSEAAFKFMVVSSIGALMVLLAAGIFYGQYNMLNLAAIGGMLRFGFLDKVALVLLVAAFAMKCGAVPMHMWVSDAYGEAPAPVSAFLVVASQASLYALFRVCFTLFGVAAATEIMGWALVVLGMLTMFIGVTMAIPQKDIKRLMSYHAVSQTGYMLLGVGVCLAVLGNAAALGSFGITAMQGGLFHVVNHAMYKGLLFLAAGAIIYRTGTRDLNKLGGLAHRMPLTAVFFLIGAFSISGLPPFNGFASKLMIYESVFRFNPLLSVIAMLTSILTLASFMKVFHSAFLGPELPEYRGVREMPPAMWISMGILAVFIMLFGIFPDLVVQYLVGPASQALLDRIGYLGGVL